MNRDARIAEDFKNYKFFLKEYFPKFDSTDPNLLEFYKYVNNAFVLCDILIEYDKVKESDNFFNLLIEYREFYARLLTTVAINNKFLVENIFRVIAEKLYRILYGRLRQGRQERAIRRESRANMKKDLDGHMESGNFTMLNDLYNDFSTKVHHTVSVPTDYFNLTQRLESKNDFLKDCIDNMEKVEKIFLEEIFLSLSPDSDNEETSYKMKIRNNTTDYVINSLKLI